jgi:hypothetical protein
MNDQEKKRKLQQRAARDRQLDNIEQALNRATDLIQDSQRVEGGAKSGHPAAMDQGSQTLILG